LGGLEILNTKASAQENHCFKNNYIQEGKIVIIYEFRGLVLYIKGWVQTKNRYICTNHNNNKNKEWGPDKNFCSKLSKKHEKGKRPVPIKFEWQKLCRSLKFKPLQKHILLKYFWIISQYLPDFKLFK